jgi:hypothetical protein
MTYEEGYGFTCLWQPIICGNLAGLSSTLSASEACAVVLVAFRVLTI